MARVPTYDSPQVGLQPIPRVAGGLRVSASDFGGDKGADLQRFGNAMTNLGGVGAQIATQMQDDANMIRVDDAVNQAKEALLDLTYNQESGYTTQKGRQAFDRASGKPLADEYHEEFTKRGQAIASTLGNDVQKQVFGEKLGQMSLSFKEELTRYQADQFNTYTMSVRKGTIENAVRDIGINYNNPDAIAENISAIQRSVADLGRRQGLSAEEIQSSIVKATSAAHRSALDNAIAHMDIAYADTYLQAFSSQMEVDDILSVQGVLTKEKTAAIATNAVGQVLGEFSAELSTSDFDRAWTILKGRESGGQHFRPDGSVITSNKGAVGIAQVMPTTGPIAAKMAGLPWEEKRYRNDPAYNEALGKAYFAQQLKDFGGNLAYAYAAYNGGPARTREAIQKHGAEWLQHMPKETQDYVAANMEKYSRGLGRAKPPTDEDVMASLDQKLPNNPEARKIAETEIRRRLQDHRDALKQAQEGAMQDAYAWLWENRGKGYADMPVEIRRGIPPEKVDSLLTFEEKVNKPADVKTDWEIYYRLRQTATERPEIFAREDLVQYFDRLAPSQRESLMDLQKTAKEGNKDKLKDVATLDQQLGAAHDMLKLGGKDNDERRGNFDQQVYAAIDAEQAKKGKPLTYDERQTVIDQLAMEGRVVRNWWPDNTARWFEVRGTDKEEAFMQGIPPEDRRQIVEALQATGQQISNDAIVRWYYTLNPKGKPGG